MENKSREPTILALDVSTSSTGYAVYRAGECITSGTLVYKDKDWVVRVRKMSVDIYNLSNSLGITHVVVEDTYVSKNINTVKKLCMAQGILIGNTFNAKVIQVYPTSWKSYFGLTKKKTTRASQKQSSLTIAETLHRLNTDSDDEADAVLLGKYVWDNREELL